ncbi:hypothetical protein GQ457_17G026790 [Hibiscus cannabinus]
MERGGEIEVEELAPTAAEGKLELSVDDVMDRYMGSLGYPTKVTPIISVDWQLRLGSGLEGTPPPQLLSGILFAIARCAFYGRLADAWLCRKKTLLVSCILTSITTFMTSLSPNVWIYALLRFANGFVCSGSGKKLPNNIELVIPSSSTTITCEEGDKNKSPWTTKWAAKRMVIIMTCAFGVGFVYYGMQLNVENLNFNFYVTVIINALMDVHAVLIGGVLLGFTNRRLLLLMSTISAGVMCLLCIILFTTSKDKAKVSGDRSKSTSSWSQLTIEAIGFMCASITFNVSYVYCVELFPTNVATILDARALLSPLLVVVGRLSSCISFVVFGALSIVSGVSVCPKTNHEIENFRKLQRLHIAENHFNFKLPKEIGNMFQLVTFNASSNLLSGRIPYEIVNCKKLQQLDLSRDSFIVMDLSINRLTRNIPRELELLNMLEFLLLNNNNLTSAIPSTFESLSSLMNMPMSSFIENKGLCGRPLRNCMVDSSSSMLPAKNGT